MNRSKPRIKVVVWSGVLLVAGGAIFCLCYRNRLAARVDQILKRDMMPGKNNWKAGMDALWALGPGIIPHLAADAGLRETTVSRNYSMWYKKLPAGFQRYLPPPVNRVELRETAMRAIAEFGPLAVRGAGREVIARLSDQNGYYAVQSLRWLLPESAAALSAFKRGLAGTNANWPGSGSFFNVDSSVWTEIPGGVPLLTNFLWSTGRASQAAFDLGSIGSNAASAIPALIEMVDSGAVGSLPDTGAAQFHPSVSFPFSTPLGGVAKILPAGTGMSQNRAVAALALGRIGVATPEVRAALVRAWSVPDAAVRHNAALAVALLGPTMTNDLPGLLAGLRDPDNSALDSKLKAIAKLGPAAAEAVPMLLELTQIDRVRSLVADPGSRVSGWRIEDLSASAKMAICRLDPAEGRHFLPEIAERVGTLWDSVEFLTMPGPLSDEVVSVVEPALAQPGGIHRSIAAYIILCHVRNYSKALAVLRRNESAGELNDRLLAGRLLFESIGETNGLCALISEAFNSPKSNIGQNAGQLAEKMGAAALPALPAFKAALWHKDVFVRNWAGKLVIKLAPEEIPIKGDR